MAWVKLAPVVLQMVTQSARRAIRDGRPTRTRRRVHVGLHATHVVPFAGFKLVICSLSSIRAHALLCMTVNSCKCEDGTPATGAKCPQNGGNMCVECKSGYTISTTRTECKRTYVWEKSEPKQCFKLDKFRPIDRTRFVCKLILYFILICPAQRL